VFLRAAQGRDADGGERLADGAGQAGDGGALVSEGEAAAQQLPVQARADSGRRLSIAAQEQEAAGASPRGAGPGEAVWRDREEPAGSIGASLHRSRVGAARGRVLDESGAALAR